MTEDEIKNYIAQYLDFVLRLTVKEELNALITNWVIHVPQKKTKKPMVITQTEIAQAIQDALDDVQRNSNE